MLDFPEKQFRIEWTAKHAWDHTATKFHLYYDWLTLPQVIVWLLTNSRGRHRWPIFSASRQHLQPGAIWGSGLRHWHQVCLDSLTRILRKSPNISPVGQQCQQKRAWYVWLSSRLMVSTRKIYSSSQTHLVSKWCLLISQHQHFLTIQLVLFVMIAVVTVDGEQTHTTTVIKKTLNPYWNESFDV